MQKQFTNTPTFYVYLRIILISWFLSFFFTLEVRAQSPGLAWQKSYWNSEDPINGITGISQKNSGEDWNFNVKPVIENGLISEYVYAGYSTIRNKCVAPNSCGKKFTLPQPCQNVEWINFETSNNVRGVTVPKLMATDINGNQKWYKTYGHVMGVGYFTGSCTTAVQTTVHPGYVACGSYEGVGSSVRYNSTLSTPNNHLINCQIDPSNSNKTIRHLYVLKTDEDGNELWSATYGMEDNLADAEFLGGSGEDIIEDSNGDLIIVGMVTVNEYNVATSLGLSNLKNDKIFILKIDGQTGNIIWKKILGNSGLNSAATSIVKINNGHYVIGCIQFDNQYYEYPKSSGKIYAVYTEGKTLCIEVDPSNGNQLGSSQLFGTITPGHSNNCFSIAYDNLENKIIMANTFNAFGGYVGGEGDSHTYGEIEVLDAVNLSKLFSFNLGAIQAYDIKVGVCLGVDRSIGVVSSVAGTLPPLIPIPNSFLDACSNNYTFNTTHWGTDAKVWKFTPLTATSTSLSLKWSKQFDDYSTAFGNYPLNLKRQECLYKIAPVDDGGFVITGNNGANFDDDYAARIYGDCALPQSATNPNGTNYSQNFSSILNNITSDLNITSDVNVRGRVVVHSGVTLHLTNNAIMHFADSKQVGFTTVLVIEPGGKLIMDPGTKMTGLSACNNVWDGVIVKGNCSQAQQVTGAGMFVTSNQGYVYLRNCTIENARVAFKIFNPSDYYGSGHCGGGGGIINASGVTFANCYRAVEFKKYHNPTINGVEPLNKSVLQYCTFYIDNNYNYDAGQFSEFISMWDVSGVQLHGNTYSNNTTYSGPITDWSKPNNLRAMGIYSIDAKYFVDNKLNTPSQFNNLDYGVYAQNSRDVAISVAKSNFNNNYHSIELEAANESSVRLNHFNLVQFPYEDNNIPFKPFQVGIVRSKHFKYEYNQLSQSPNATNKSTTGNYFSNTGIGRSADNKSLGNTFSGFSYATVSNYQNRFFNPTSGTVNGLNFICNTNTNNSKADYTIYNQSATDFDGIAEFIGDYNGGNTISAADVFTNSTRTGFCNINNYSQHTITWFCNSPANYANCISSFVLMNTGNYPYTCPTPPTDLLSTPYSGGAVYNANQLAQKESNFNYEFNQHNYYENMLNSLIDNGNTVQLTADVANTLTPEVQARRLELLNQSPFLSTDVLLELCNKINVFGDAVVFEILMANPDVTREVAFEEQLINMVEQSIFPEWMYESITANSDQVTYRTILNRNDSKAVSNMMQTFRDVSYSLQNDSTGFDHTIYRHWLQLLQNPEADMTLAEEYLEEANVDLANAIIDSIPIKYMLNEKQEMEHTDFRDWMNLKIQWLTNYLAIDSLDAVNLESLKSFADGHNSSAGIKAKNVVSFFYGGAYRNYPDLPEDGQSQSRPVIQSKIVNKMEAKNYVKVYPNPSSDFVNVEYKVPSASIAHIEVFDAAGKSVLNQNMDNAQFIKIIDVTQFVNGTYFYKVVSNNTIFGQGHFVVQK